MIEKELEPQLSTIKTLLFFCHPVYVQRIQNSDFCFVDFLYLQQEESVFLPEL